MGNRLTLVAIACLASAVATDLPAQVAHGDAAWAAGRYREASAAYQQALVEDPGQVRANYRLAILASWENRLDSALTLIGRAREREKDDPDVRFAEALILSWAGRYPEAIAKYDSLLARHPEYRDAELGRARTLAWADRTTEADAAYQAMLERNPRDHEALAGRAQLAAWQGEYDTAIARYRAVLDREPANATALLGLGRVYYYQGRARRAIEPLERAVRLEPPDRDAVELHRTVRAEIRPQVTLRVGWSDDSDDNSSWWQTLSSSYLVVDGVRGFATAGLLQASDPAGEGSRSMGEVGASFSKAGYRLTGALGLRHLSPDGGTARTMASYRAAVLNRFSPTVSAGVGFAHYPFDETANLIGRGLEVDELDASLDVRLRPTLSLSAGGGAAWVSDDNQRTSLVLALTQTIARDLSLGVFGRRLSYDQSAPGYFTPDRFSVLELRAGYAAGWSGWSARLGGGVGVQQVGKGADGQTAWHVEGRLARNWSAINQVELFGAVTNSALSSTTGAFRYGTAGLAVRLGL